MTLTCSMLGVYTQKKGKRMPRILALLRCFFKIGRPTQIDVAEHVYVPQIAFGTHCYMVSRKGMENLIAAFEANIKFHIDFQIQLLQDLTIYALDPNLAWQCSEVESTMLSAKFPWFINSRLEKILDHSGISYGYHFTVPAYQLLGEHINLWTHICLYTGIFMAILGVPAEILILAFSAFMLIEWITVRMTWKTLKTALFLGAVFLLPTVCKNNPLETAFTAFGLLSTFWIVSLAFTTHKKQLRSSKLHSPTSINSVSELTIQVK